MIMVVMIFAGRACGVGLVGLSSDYGCDGVTDKGMWCWVGRSFL